MIAVIALTVGGLFSGLVVLYQPHWLVAELAERSPEVLYFVETRERVVALTIDDGPDPETTPEILRVLARHGAQATFFLISRRIEGHEPLVARIVREGHELGNHLTRDRSSIALSAREFEAALLEADRTLSRFGPVRWFRPTGGWYDEPMLSIAADHGYRCALGSIYPYDALIPWPDFAAFHVLSKVRPGSIIILHDAGTRGRRTVEALRQILPELNRRGFDVVTLSQLVDSAVRTRPGQHPK
ncbi:MAG: polysaccharide deacetylase family protein [Gemmatimonadetes bacterium]|nr:polysaccharide deacetylase family protein [Gemmatimonadota bacterium]